ncbi:unnamed protein product [marine sediment metagenome]|uniref:Uncharacterized protein n=1 Tax=marine sediment metagenome TaxID=412755 RepID=X1E0F7_9ZZZZ
MTSVYPLKDILEWYLHGIWQNVLIWIPLLRPSPEPYYPPQFWYEYWPRAWWNYGLDSTRRPDANWVWRWLTAVKEAFRVKVQNVGDVARDAAAVIVRYWLGYVQGAYTTFQAWIMAVEGRVGWWIPGWASNLADAAQRLYNWLPSAIRYSWQTWDQIWENIKASVRAWARARYDAAVGWASASWNWVTGWGNVFISWYNAAYLWLRAFQADPVGMVIGWLGPQWARLVRFALDCLDFWYNLWGSYAAILADFLADPLGWLYDRAEDELVRRW